MRATERDVLLFLLAIASGVADGWSYFGLGHAFVANMTGNTVLLGVSLFLNRSQMLHPAIALGCYAVGVAVASFSTGRRIPQPQTVVWTRAVSWVLLLEAALMAGVEIGWYALHRGAGVQQNALLAVLAFAIGLQSGAMVQLKVPGIVTTYITGTWTTMVSGLTRLLTSERREPAARKTEFAERVSMQAGILLVYFLAAVFTGWLFRHHALAIGIAPVVCLSGVGIYGMVRGGGYSVIS